MKNILNFIVVLVCFAVSMGGCSVADTKSNVSIAPAVERNLLLEVKTETSATVYPSGRTLDLRLYDNREVEFDFYLPNTPDRIGKPFESERRRSHITDKEFEDFLLLLNQTRHMGGKDFYAATQRVLDATIRKTITLDGDKSSRVIILEENDSHLHLREKGAIYPPPLLNLLELVENTNRRLRKEINPESR